MTTYSGLDFWRAHLTSWPVVPLRRIAHLGTGHTPSRNHPEYWDNCTIPWVTTEDLTARRGTGLEPLMDTRQKISELGLANSAAELHPADTVMLSRTASIGHVVRIGRPMATTQAFVTWTCGPKLDPGYLHVVLLAMKPEFERLAYGSTHLTIYMPDIEQIHVPVPERETQRRVVSFLQFETARIDALIEKKQLLLDLMSMRRDAAIGEAIDSTEGEALPLRRVVEAFVDYRGATPEKATTGVPLITATNVADGAIDFSLGEQFLSEATYVEWMRRGFPENGDVVLTTEAPLGEVAVITNPRVALAQRIILLKPNQRRVEPEFLYASLRSPRVQADLLSRASGSTVWGIRSDRLREVRLRVPTLSDQRHVIRRSQQVEREYRRARDTLRAQVDLLDEHRQVLITAAVTGQLDVAKVAA